MNDSNSPDSGSVTTTPRSRRTKLVIVGIVGALVLAAAVPLAMAGRHHWRTPLTDQEVRDRVDRHSHRVMDKLDATDAQHDELDALIESVFPDAMVLRKEGKQLKAKFRQALLADSLDKVELENLRQEALALADKGSKKALETLLQFEQILTDEQKTQAKDRIRSRWTR